MPETCCEVSFCDSEGISHSVEVVASSLFEAAALALARFRRAGLRVQIIGDRGRIEIEIPFNAPPDRPARIFVHTAAGLRAEEFPVCDQYAIQGDLFSKAVRGHGDVPTPLEDSIRNMAVLDAIFQSEREGRWVQM